MNIAIVILNWNGKKLLEQFLPSVVKFSDEAEIYVADNHSSDNSIAFLMANYPKIKIVKNKSNGGFSKGYNDALKHIETDVFCLLNNDVEVTKDWLKSIITLFKKEKKTSIVQPKILDFKRKTHFEYAGAAGGFIDKYAYPYCRGRIFDILEEDKGQYNDIQDIFWASGACFFIKKEVYHALNGFDEFFFAHMEEIDLCWRAKNLGHAVKYVGTSKVYHLGGATLKNTDPKKTFLNFRNSLFALTKNANGFIVGKIFVRLLLDGLAGIKFLFEIKPKHTLAVLKAHLSFYFNLNRVLKQRTEESHKMKYYSKTSIVFDYFLKNITKKYY